MLLAMKARDVIGALFDPSIITVSKQSFLLVKLSVDQSFSRSQFYLSPSMSRLYCAGNCL